MNTAHSLIGKRLLGLAIIVSGFAQTTNAQSPAPESFQMTFFEDAAHGRAISKGKYSLAVDKLTRQRDSGKSNYKSKINLCVAYTKARELEKAFDACDGAVAILNDRQSSIKSRRNRFNPIRDEYLADLSIALSNQGVLYAVKGDDDRARLLFEKALNLEADRSNARDNLRHLSSVGS